MKKLEWKYLEHENCARCGGSCEVFSESKDDNTFYDQEDVECVDCGLKGMTNVDGDEDDEGNCIGSVQWDDFEEKED